MITDRELKADRASKVARLGADNARLRKLAAELQADVSELRAAVGKVDHRPGTPLACDERR